MRLQTSLKVLLSEDDDQLNRYLAPIQINYDDTLVLKAKSARLSLPALTVDQPFTFTPEVTNAKYVLILVFTNVLQYRFNGIGAVQLALEPLPAASAAVVSSYQKTPQPGVLYAGPFDSSAPLTSLHLSNPHATLTVDCFVAVIGEAA